MYPDTRRRADHSHRALAHRRARTRYVTPLREGGSLPGLIEADDDGLYVVKFRGAGQGVSALVAEVIVGELARALGLLVPELVTVELDPALGAAEPDPEIQELIVASAGLEPRRRLPARARSPYVPGGAFTPDPELAADDRVARRADDERRPHAAQPEPAASGTSRMWLIDHGAALYLHHQRARPGERRARGRSR